MNSRIARIYQNKTTVSCGTHDGKFHTDELVALALVNLCFGNICRLTVHRTRDPEMLEQCDLVLDVGYKNHGKYLDHHGRDFVLTHPETNFKLATTGLVWYDLKEILLDVIGLKHQDASVRDMAADMIFKRIILPTDVDDNGQFGPRPAWPASMALPEIVNTFNTQSAGPAAVQASFQECLCLVQTIVSHKLSEIVRQSTENKRIHTALLEASEQDKSEGLFLLETPGPWITAVLNNWEDAKIFKVCIFPGDESGQWCIQTFPGSRHDRKSMRCPAPAYMRGYQRKSGSSLIENLNVIFVYSNGFIGRIEGTLEDAKAFARLWVSQSQN